MQSSKSALAGTPCVIRPNIQNALMDDDDDENDDKDDGCI